jgi:O-antigen ligase
MLPINKKKPGIYTGIILCLLISSIWSAYVSSWIPSPIGPPVGALLRDSILFLLLILCVWRYFSLKHTTKINVFLLIIWLTIVYYCALIIPFSPAVDMALNGIRVYILFPAVFLILYILSATGRDLRNSQNFIITIFLINCFLTALIGILDVATLGELPLILGYNPDFGGGDFKQVNSFDGFIRATGGFADALNFGYLMSIGYLVSLDVIFVDENRYLKRIFVGLVAFLCFIACVMSLTRGAILVVLIVTFFYILRHRAVTLFVLVASLSFIIIISVSPELYDLLFIRFTDGNLESAGSTQGRIDMAIDSIKYLSNHFMGSGLGTQGAANRFSNTDFRINTDNYFFWAALEIGIIGSLIFFLYIFLQFYVTLQLKKVDGFTVLMIILFISSGLISSAPTSAIFSVSFWLMLFVRNGDLKQKAHKYNRLYWKYASSGRKNNLTV